ncbi:MAG: peptidylprolyl isomerase [Dehalococcoidia bacterium]|nr:peptidylprolyl isomerase [Dehalococcoidia bacterium]
MRNPKRLAPLLAALSFVCVSLVLAACGGGEEDSSASSPTGRPTAAAAASPTQPANCPPPSGTAPEPDVNKKYASRPAISIDTAKDYNAIVKTVRGDFTMVLRASQAPETVNSFVFLARDGFFNGAKFHRVVPGFVAQTGDPTGTGSGGPGYSVPAEFNDIAFERGTVGMARSQDVNSGGSQWFVTFGNAAHLTGAYTAFGSVTEGMEVVDCIEQGDAVISVDISEA